MPSFGPIGSLKNLMALVKEINFDEVRERAETPPRLLVVGTTQAAAEQAAARLFGDEGKRYVDAVVANGSLTDLGRYDAVVVVGAAGTGLVDRIRREYPTVGHPAPVLALAGSDDRSVDRCRAAIVSADPDLAPAIGRFLPACRKAAAKAIIDETSKANAQFSAVSNISSVVPVVGTLVAVGADMVILTKNQLMMVYKLAAVNGRDLHNQMHIFRELIPVVGAGFLWRTAAREATSLIPLAAGTIPKVAIAYVGTVTVGRAADFYYQTGQKSTKSQIEAFKQQALESLSNLPLPKGTGKPDDASAPDARALPPVDAGRHDPGETAPLPNGKTEPVTHE